MFKSLRIRIVLILVLLMTALMLVLGTFLMNNITEFYNDDFKKQMENLFISGKELPESLRGALLTDSPHMAMFNILKVYTGPMGIDSYRDFYILSSKDGSFLVGSNDLLGPALERTPNLIKAMSGEIGAAINSSAAYFDYAYPISNGEAGYIIYIKDTKDELREIIWVIFAILVQGMLFALILSIVMSIFLSKAITNPVENITKGAMLVAAGNYGEELPVQSKDEIGTLTKTFNSMSKVLKNTMDEIESERSKLEAIFYYLIDGVVAFTKDNRLLHYNQAAERLLGRPLSDGESFEEIFSHIKFDTELVKIKEEVKTRTIKEEFYIGEKILEGHFGLFDFDEKEHMLAGGMIVVLHDITERVSLEQSRKEFVANVSHELRTPLTSIKSYTETVLTTKDIPPELMSRFLGIVINEADRMTRIVKDLLLLSRLDNNKMDWVFSTFLVKQLLTNVYDTLLFDAGQHSHNFILDIKDDLGYYFGDRERLEQVLINITANAIKYCPDRSRIIICALNEERALTFKVTDDGPGIPKEDIPHIFERFYRVDKARSREKGGTGLGLAIAKEIVEAHGGEITVESQMETGTAVTISLPNGGAPGGKA